MSRWSSDGNAAAMDRTIGGFLMGGDALIAENLRLGVMGGYSLSRFSVDDRASAGMADTYTLGAYGGGEWDAFTLKGGLAHSWHSLDTSRSMAFSGFSDDLSASYGARTLQAWGEAAYSFEAGAVRLEPFANLAYVNLSTDGFTETGVWPRLTPRPALLMRRSPRLACVPKPTLPSETSTPSCVVWWAGGTRSVTLRLPKCVLPRAAMPSRSRVCRYHAMPWSSTRGSI